MRHTVLLEPLKEATEEPHECEPTTQNKRLREAASLLHGNYQILEIAAEDPSRHEMDLR